MYPHSSSDRLSASGKPGPETVSDVGAVEDDDLSE